MDNSWQKKCNLNWNSTAMSSSVSASFSQIQPQQFRNQPEMNTDQYLYPHVEHEARFSAQEKVRESILFNTLNMGSYKSDSDELGNPFHAFLSGSSSSSMQKIFSSDKPPIINNSYPMNGSTQTVVPLAPNGLISDSLRKRKHRNEFFGPNLRCTAMASSYSSTPTCFPQGIPSTSCNFQRSANLKCPNLDASQKISLEKNTPLSNRSSNFSSACPRVLCLSICGDLLLSNTGLLGVVCSCHCLHMSISKFCEHSGLHNVNPGDAVHMENGETIAQWRKLYLQKFEITVPEDQNGWDWPECFSATSGLTLPSLPKQDPYNIPISENNFNYNLHKKLQRKDQESCNNLFKGLIGASQISMGPSSKFVEGGGPNCKSRNSFISQPTLDNLRMTTCTGIPNFKKTCNFSIDGVNLDQDAVSSNIELKLGQPYQPSRASGTALPLNTQENNVVLANKCGQYPQWVSTAPDYCSMREQNHAVDIATHLKQCKDDSSKSSVISMLLSRINALSEENVRCKPNHNMKTFKEHSLHHKIQSETHIDKSRPFNFPCNRLANDSSHFAVDSVYKSEKQIEDSFFLNGGLCKSGNLTMVNDKTVDPYHFSGSVNISPSQTDSMCFTTVASTLTSALPIKESVGIKPCLVDENLRVLAARNMMELYKQRNDISSSGMKQHGKIYSSSSTIYPCAGPLSSEQIHQINEHNMHEIRKPFQTSSLGRVSVNDDKLASTTGLQNWGNFSTFIQGSPSCSKAGINSYSSKQNPPSIEETENTILFTKHGESYNRVPHTCFSGKCLEGGLSSNLETSTNVLNEQIGSVKCNHTLPSNIDTVFKENTISLETNEKFKEEKFKKINYCHSFQWNQWKDVPNKVRTLKEKEISNNISSDCSAPEVIQESTVVTNTDSCTIDETEHQNINNFAIDEGSANDNCGSSNDIPCSKRSAELLGSTCEPAIVKKKSFEALTNQLSGNLIDEIKHLDSLRWKNVPNHTQTGPNPNYRRSSVSSIKSTSRKRDLRRVYFDQDENTEDEDYLEVPRDSCVKKTRQDRPPDAMKHLCLPLSKCNDFKASTKSKSINSTKTICNWKMNDLMKNARPLVHGKYGIISNGKPPNIVLLSKVLKSATCTLSKRYGAKSPFKREVKKNRSEVSTELFDNVYGWKKENHKSIVHNELDLEYSMEAEQKARLNIDKENADQLCMLEEEKDINKEKFCSSRLKPKAKEIRRRSLFEILVTGNKSKCAPEKKCVSFENLSSTADDSKHQQNGEEGDISAKKTNKEHSYESFISEPGGLCCVCASSDKDEVNYLLECSHCLIRVHQACYGVAKVPKGSWYCRPCRTNLKDIACVLCGYGGGAMTRALNSGNIVQSLVKLWNVETEGGLFPVILPSNTEMSSEAATKLNIGTQLEIVPNICGPYSKLKNSITLGVLDPTVKQWVHMVCGLWTPGTRCPNVDTMNAFDVSGASYPAASLVCSICNRSGGSYIRCRVAFCSVQFHPWCAHQKGLLQSEVEGIENENVGFYGTCVLHSTSPSINSCKESNNNETDYPVGKELTCARTEGYKGRKRDGFRHNVYSQSNGNTRCLVPQEQLNAWQHINGLKSRTKQPVKQPVSDMEHDCRKEYARYKHSKGWKHLVVYKSGIHALGLYTSQFITRGAVVVEYVGEIVGLRVADKRESEYQTGRKLQYKSACYFFKIDKEQIIDATCKGGIARFVNHSCLPNCVAKVISVRNEKKVVFFAERDIYPGEEITYDYHFNHEDEGKKIPCFCNAKKCRKYMN